MHHKIKNEKQNNLSKFNLYYYNERNYIMKNLSIYYEYYQVDISAYFFLNRKFIVYTLIKMDISATLYDFCPPENILEGIMLI